MAAGRFDEAAALYAAITRALPDEPGMLLNHGMALAMAGRPAEAVPRLQAALKRRPDLLPAALFLGVAEMELGHAARAVEPLQKVVAAQPDNVEARRRLADAFWQLDRFDAAVREYGELTRQTPDDPRAWYGLGQAYEGLAHGAFERLRRQAPESEYMSLLVAQTMADEGRQAEAFRLYREALARTPGRVEAHEAIARIYADTGHADWAAMERERARALPPPDCSRPSDECEFQAGRFDALLSRAPATDDALYWRARAAKARAEQAFSRLESLPPSPEATLRRVERMRARKRTLAAEVIAELRKAAQAWPEDTRIRRELASVLFLAGETEEARPILEDLLAREPDSAELQLLLGETWLKSLQPAKAVPLLERAVAREPDRLAAQSALGRAYLAAGDAARAVPPLERALSTDQDGSLHYQLARAYRATGQAERAAAATARFQELRQAWEAEAASRREEFQITPP